MRLKAYLSGPISEGGTLDRSGQRANAHYAALVGMDLIELGFAVLCPHLTVYQEDLTETYLDHDTWINNDLPWVIAADLVVRLPGRSKGADAECRAAQKADIPVYAWDHPNVESTLKNIITTHALLALAAEDRQSEAADKSPAGSTRTPSLDGDSPDAVSSSSASHAKQVVGERVESFSLKDSGERQVYAGGMVRDVTEGKARYDLPFDGPMFARWAEHLTKGAVKYEPRNWMRAKGDEERERFRESAVRHFIQWLHGETDEDHAAAVYFNINGVEYLNAERPESKSSA